MDAAFNFRVSSALKDIIGRDLITNDFVAVFELVKNAFDAHASRVDIVFEPDRIVIADNGKGMTLADIREKWLFVAYSAKKTGEEDSDLPTDYRDLISLRRGYAGNKGIGRFSCDRLGGKLALYTRSVSAKSAIECLRVDWADFERNAKSQFTRIPVRPSKVHAFPTLPANIGPSKHGTVLEITGLRDEWRRPKLLKLKEYLAKLINPFGTVVDMQIYIHADEERSQDEQNIEALDISDELLANYPDRKDALAHVPGHFADIVNGPVGNLVFKTLENKTTKLEVNLDGALVRSKLIDRGRLIYEIEEDNSFNRLKQAQVSFELFYLNRAAKIAFTRSMGVESVKFGSVFLFLNGFRVFPIGEPDDDTFRLNVRKAQGYARHLGTRELLGRVDVVAPHTMFRETSSRDGGLIDTPATQDLMECFRRLVLQRLERYVVDVTWVDKLDAERPDTSGLGTDSARARIVEVVSKLVENPNIRLLDYARDLVDTINERANEFEATMEGLAVVASRTGDRELLSRIEQARRRHDALRRAEQHARERAEAESAARVQAEVAARDASARAESAEQRYAEERKRSLFLAAIQGKDSETLVNLHHQVVIYATAVQDMIANILYTIRKGHALSAEDIAADLEQISFQNSRILTVTRFVTQANFRLDADAVVEDLVQYLDDYVTQVSTLYEGAEFVRFSANGQTLQTRFRPIDIAIIVDNLVSNARRAKATSISFECRKTQSGDLEIVVEDNGRGLDAKRVDRERIFEKGYSSTNGSGLGLYHVANVLAEIGGSIALDREQTGRGARFLIRIPRPRKRNSA